MKTRAKKTGYLINSLRTQLKADCGKQIDAFSNIAEKKIHVLAEDILEFQKISDIFIV